MPRGGCRPGAGRKPGSPNRKTRRLAEAIKAEAEVNPGKMTPLEFLVDAMLNADLDYRTRLDAAKAAAPFVHPRLAMTKAEITTEVLMTHEDALAALEAGEAMTLPGDS